MDDKFLSIDVKIAKQSLPHYQALALLKDELLCYAAEQDIPVRQIYNQYLDYRKRVSKN